MESMNLQDVLQKLRRADKVTVFENDITLYRGYVNQLIFNTKLTGREVKNFHPELLDGLYIYLKGVNSGTRAAEQRNERRC